MAKRNIVDEVSGLAALGTAVLDAVKASGLLKARRRARKVTDVEVGTPKRRSSNLLRKAKPAQPSE